MNLGQTVTEFAFQYHSNRAQSWELSAKIMRKVRALPQWSRQRKYTSFTGQGNGVRHHHSFNESLCGGIRHAPRFWGCWVPVWGFSHWTVARWHWPMSHQYEALSKFNLMWNYMRRFQGTTVSLHGEIAFCKTVYGTQEEKLNLSFEVECDNLICWLIGGIGRTFLS